MKREIRFYVINVFGNDAIKVVNADDEALVRVMTNNRPINAHWMKNVAGKLNWRFVQVPAPSSIPLVIE